MRQPKNAATIRPTKLGWSCYTPGLLREILNNPGTGMLAQPLNIFGDLLASVAKRSIELDDPELNILMMRLALYEQSDPTKNSGADIRAMIEAQQARLAESNIPSSEPTA